MRKILVHWQGIIYSLLGLKLLSMLILPTWSDFLYGWTFEVSTIVPTLVSGKLPTLSTYGVYIGIEMILAPFYWIWTLLPIDHPTVANLVQYTAPAVSLGFLMKIPILLFDSASLILLIRIVRRITHSEETSIIAGLTWFANPYNFYMLYFWGAMDIIPIAVFLLAILFELEGKWFRCGISTMCTGLLRLFAFAVYPFFSPLTRTKSVIGKFVIGSTVPVAIAIGLIYLSHDTLATVFNIPAQQFWLLEFLGFNIWGMQFVRLSPVLVLFQLYVVLRFWRQGTNIVYLATVSLLALLLGATLYGGEAQHFLWVCPLLSACIAMHLEDWWIYTLTSFTALLSPTVNPFTHWTPEPYLLDTFLAGAFYAMKAIYLLSLNLSNFRIPLQLQHPAPFGQYSSPQTLITHQPVSTG